MSTPSNFHELPDPDNASAGRNTNDRGSQKPSIQAKKYRPVDAPVTEPPVATVARFANRLLNRTTGQALSAEDLGGTPTAASVAAAITEDPAAIRAAVKLSAYGSGRAVAGLRGALAADRSAGIAVCGDSTGNGSTEWINLFVDGLAERYPNHDISHQVFSGTAWSTLDSVDRGLGQRGWRFPTTGTVFQLGLSRPDFDLPQGNDMAMEVKVKVEDFSLLSGATVRGWNDYGGGDADRLFTMSIGSNKSIYFEHYTSADAHLYKGPSAAMPYVNGDTFWVRVELNAVIDDPGEEYYNGTDRHVVRSYYRTADTGAWTQLSAHLAAGTAPLRTISPTSLLTMLDIQPQRGLTVHKYRLYDSIDQSSPCLPILPVDHFDKGSANNVAELVGSPILTIHNASVSGYGVRNFIDPSQPDYVTFPNLFKDADTGVVLNMVSLGHNQWAGVQYANIGQFISGVDDIFEGMEDRFPLARRLYVGQNPKNHSETENGTANFRHANGVARLMLSAASGNHGAINVWQAFKEDGLDLSDLVVTAPGDYQHPTAAGSVLWSQTMLDAWDSHSF